MPLSKEHILTLLSTPKLGPASAKSINGFTNFKVTSINDLYDAIVDAKKDHPRIPLPDKDSLIKANSHAQMILELCNNKGITPISINEDFYPSKLKRLDDFPIMIYVKGAVSAINSKYSAGVIGTREPSHYGIKAGRRISNILARHGFSIISGLAIGCDTVGHLGALDANAPTVAVLASGVDIIYPKENQYLADKILEQGGALFSEYEVGFRPQRSSFVERDRLQTGLSDGLVVIETDMQGGTMHAVKVAQKLKIPIGCISGHPDALQDYPKTRGTKYLIENGAAVLGNVEQIFSFIQNLNPNIVGFIPEDKSKGLSSNKVLVAQSPVESSVDTIPEIMVRSYIDDKQLIEAKLNVSNYNRIVQDDEMQGIDDNVKSKNTLISYDDLVTKINELTNIVSVIAEQQDVMAKMLTSVLEQSTPKVKPTKPKQPKSEINHPKLL